MASDETMTLNSSLLEEDFDNDIDDGCDHHQHPLTHNLSRLSVCTSSTMCDVDDDDDDNDVDNVMAMFVSGLSIESFELGDGDGDDADGEFSDGGKELHAGLSSDSESELGSCYSLPATPPRRRRNPVGVASRTPIATKDYASDNEAQKGVFMMRQKTKEKDPRRRRRRRRRILRKGTWVWDNKSKNKDEEHVSHGWFSGESDQSGSIGRGVRVMTRPKGGGRSLCMDLEEVKACRDLGFELEIPPRLSVSISNSTLETSSGGNSPISNWRISSPGKYLL